MAVYLNESFDGVTPPALPAGLTVQAGSLVTAASGSAYTAPNVLTGGTGSTHNFASIGLDTNGGNVSVCADLHFPAINGSGYQIGSVFARAPAANSRTGSYVLGLGVGPSDTSDNSDGLVLVVPGTAVLAHVGRSALAAATWYRVILTCVGTAITGRCVRLSDGHYLQPGGTFASTAADAISVTDATTAGAGYAGVDLYSDTLGNIALLDGLQYGTNGAVPVAGGTATAFTLTGPSQGPAGAASSNFTVTPTGGNYTGTVTPSGTGCTFTPSSLTWSAAADAKTFTVTRAAGTVNINGTASPSLTQPSNVSYTAKTTTTRTYTVDGGLPATATGFTAKNNDATKWAERTTAVTDQGGGTYSIAGVVVPDDYSGVVVWDQGGVIASEPMDNRPAGGSGPVPMIGSPFIRSLQ
jgi:hypothetical protein